MPLEITASAMREASKPTWNPEDDTVNLTAIDFSSIDQYLRCPKQYEFRHLQGRKEPPGVALAEGISHHFAVEKDNKRKMKKGRNYSAKKLVDLFVDRWERIIPDFQEQCDGLRTKMDWNGEDENKIVNRAKTFLGDYSTHHSPRITPTSVEETISKDVDIAGVKFKLFGQLDLTTAKSVLDYKVTGKAKSERDARESLQLSLYSWMKNKKSVGFINFVKKTSPEIRRIEAIRQEKDWLWALRVAASVVKAIRQGVFPLTAPEPMNWWCSERFCGYWLRCRGKHA